MKRKVNLEAIKTRLPAVLFWLVVLGITAGLYTAASARALAFRGYKAVGGEAFIWLLLPATYAVKRWAAGVLKRSEPLDAEYTPVLEPVKLEELAEATAKLSGVMATVGVSSKDAAEAFQMLTAAIQQERTTPLNIAFLAPDHRLANIAYQQFLRDNDLLGIYPRRRYPTTLTDGTRIALISGKDPDAVAAGRRFDQIVIVSDARGRFAAEVKNALEKLLERTTGRVPEEYLLQYYEIDAELPEMENRAFWTREPYFRETPLGAARAL